MLSSTRAVYFNPRPHVGSDKIGKDWFSNSLISIHAPM
ncbi:hypothetical protein B4096_2013 [Heyndrickxia coagulans]|nr:hypothetical protein B4096_2013 [Heyndrickxia coagulans]